MTCTYERMKGKQQCHWHWLLKQSPDLQRANAEARLQMHLHQPGFARRARVPKEEWPSGERWCSGCQSFVPIFYASGSRCKSCASSAAHASRTEKVYGITAARYDEILRLQGRRCAICGNQPRSMRLAVDHDHKTGEVRGLLCKRCNHDLLGGGHDSIDLLWKAIVYLISPPAQRAPGFVPTDEHMLEALKLRQAHRQALAQQNAATAQPPPF